MFNRPPNSSIPRQQVDYATKFEKEVDKYGVSRWMKDTVDALEAIGRYSLYNNVQLRKNYEIIQGRFNIEDYVDSFDAYDISSIIYEKMKLPSFLKHYDIITKAVKLLLGEYIKRPDLTFVKGEDMESLNERNRAKTELMQQYFQQELRKEIQQKMLQQGIDPFKNEFKNQEEQQQYQQFIQQKEQELTPEGIDKYMKYDFRTAGELWGQTVILNDKKRFNLNEQDQIEFFDMLVVDRCFSHFYLSADGYGVEVWNPRDVFHEYSSDIRYIEDGAYAGRVLYISKSRIIDVFGWKMKIEQIEALYPEFQKGSGNNSSVYNEFFNATLYPFADYREASNIYEAYGYGLDNALNSFPTLPANPYSPFPYGDANFYFYNQPDLVQISQVYWRSQRKIGKLNLLNPETGEVTVEIVDETFEPKLFGIEEVKETFMDSDEPNTICWTWITQTWQGVKINTNHDRAQTPEERSAIYVDVRPCPFQFKGNNPKLTYKSKLPVCGQVFNNRNGRSQSLVDLLVPYQIFVNAFYNQAYHTTQKNNGKTLLLGASLLGNIKDLGGEDSLQNFMTMATNLGVSVVDDSSPEAKVAIQYAGKVLDMDETEKVVRCINAAMLIEQQGFLQIGITPQRQGSIQASETATGTQAAVNNSYAITEIYFEQYSNYRRRKLQMLLDIAQFCALREDDITLPYVTPDIGQDFIKINSNDLLLRDLGVYISNSGEAYNKKKTIEQLLLSRNQDQIPLSEIVNVFLQDNPTEIKKSLQMWEQKAQEAAQQAKEAEMQQQQAQFQAEMEDKEKQREWESNENQLDRQAELERAMITSSGFDADVAKNPNGEIDVIAQGKLLLDQQNSAFDNILKQREMALKTTDTLTKHQLEKDKLKSSEKIAQKQNAIKEKEMNSKLQIENKKLQQIQAQNASQEKISLLKHKNDKELADKKIQLEKIKIKAKPKTPKK